MRVLVVGASGLVGNALLSLFRGDHQAVGTFCNHPLKGLRHLDLTDPAQVQTVVRQTRPEVVLQPAAIPNVEYCETHPEQTWAVNVQGTAHLLDAVRAIGARLVFFSSDYIFDGRAGPYAEQARPNPLNVYGRQKLAAEERIRSTLRDYLIVRTTVVYGWEHAGKNFVARLVRQLGQGRPVRAPVDQIGTPTYVRNLAQVVKELVEGGHRGIFNVVGPQLIDRYRFACLAARVFGLDERGVLPVTTAELDQVAARPLQAGLRVDKVQATVETRLLGPEEGLEAMRAREELAPQHDDGPGP